jgi:uncharacterized LabA/DUF88 family protein
VTDASEQLLSWARRLDATADGQPLRASIFIDDAYLFHVLKDEFRGAKFPWALAASILAPGFHTVATSLYAAPPEDPETRVRFDGFRKFMEQAQGVQMRLGVLSGAPGGKYEQKQVDVLLAVDLVLSVCQARTDVVVLLAGDSDFVPAVRAAREMGAYTILWHGDPRWASNELRESCDERHRLTHIEIQVT